MHRFKRISTFLILAALAIATTGCPPDQAKTAKTSGDLATEGPGDPGSELVGDSTITQRELDELRANFERVLFDYDRAELTEESRAILATNADILIRHTDVRVRIEGHADHWGSDIYNLALGQRRADVVRMYLVDLGVTEGQLDVISYGEERPLVGEADRNAEAPHRRAEFLVIVAGENAAIGSSY